MASPVPPLYTASAPVFRHYLGQAMRMIDKAGPEAMLHRVADAFPAGQQFATAAGFAMRVCCPLAGREVPDLPTALAPRLAVVRATLGALRPDDFKGADARRYRHKAGMADLDQSAEEFLHLYGLPNFFFHLTMGYAALRAAGVDLGKADFDGFHAYPPAFHFDD